MTNQFQTRREQMLRELASDLANLVESGDLTDNEANEWLAFEGRSVVRKLVQLRGKSPSLPFSRRIQMQIVVAWAEQTKLVPTGRHVMRDMNWFPEFRTEWEGRAAMWSRKGTDAELAKAAAYAAKEGVMVLTFPDSEKDPLAKARANAVKQRHERRQ